MNMTLKLFEVNRTEAREIAYELTPKYEKLMDYMHDFLEDKRQHPEKHFKTEAECEEIYWAYNDLWFACLKLTGRNTRRNMELEWKVKEAIDVINKHRLEVY